MNNVPRTSRRPRPALSNRPKPIDLLPLPGVNNTTVWSDPEAGSNIEFSSFANLAQTAERAKFDSFLIRKTTPPIAYGHARDR
jgi:hypothetical protein